MNKSFFSEKLDLLFAWIFVILPLLFAAIGLAQLIFYAASFGPLDFSLNNGPPTHHGYSKEAYVLICAIGYMLCMHVLRFALTMGSLFWNQWRALPPGFINAAMLITSGVVFMAYLIFFTFWLIYADIPKTCNFTLIGGFFALLIVTFIICSSHWTYGFKRNQQVSDQNPVQDQVNGLQFQAIEASAPADSVPEKKVARREIPNIKFSDIHGNADIKRRLLDAGMAIIDRSTKGRHHHGGQPGSRRNGILLFGEPGNGKTMFAQALAGELKVPIFILTHADASSEHIGGRTANIKAAFDQAKASQPCVLFIDEIDSQLPDRANTTRFSNKDDSDVVNALLPLMDEIRKHQVVVMAATNLLDNLDPASKREGRFDFKIEITPPDEQARIGLLTAGLKKNLGKVMADPETIRNVAQRWNGFSVKRILSVTEELGSYLYELKEDGAAKSQLEFEDFMTALRRIQGQLGARPENVKPMNELILTEETTESLAMLCSRLRDPQKVERLGGTLPTGVLFYGPPGTGKTATCKALVKEVDWALLISTGTDLVREPQALDKLYTKAKDLRPCIVFIDEADDLIRNRDYSSNAEATNKLLALMDGVKDRVRDVVWIAATNNPQCIEPALLRGGRFTEKVAFSLPSELQRVIHTENWLEARNVYLEVGLTEQIITSLVGDESIANLEAVLQYAVNSAISKIEDNQGVVLTNTDVMRALKAVLSTDLSCLTPSDHTSDPTSAIRESIFQ
jgi:transitional endoplasmic reticulum ATPase